VSVGVDRGEGKTVRIVVEHNTEMRRPQTSLGLALTPSRIPALV
jgi:hypothetical protein